MSHTTCEEYKLLGIYLNFSMSALSRSYLRARGHCCAYVIIKACLQQEINSLLYIPACAKSDLQAPLP